MIFKNRRSNGVSFMPGLLSFMLTVFVAGLTTLLYFYTIPSDNREPLLVLLGVVTAVWKDSMAYWWQSTRSSQEKDKMLSNSIPANLRRDDDSN
jgi:hypothetical protein